MENDRLSEGLLEEKIYFGGAEENKLVDLKKLLANIW